MLTLAGAITRIAYQNPENHYTVARLQVDDTGREISVVGHLPGVSCGQNVIVSGNWETHARFGEQFKVAEFEIALPQAVDEIRNYLSSGFIEGVGPKIVARIVGHFGDQTLAVIEATPALLKAVPGVGPKTVERITNAWHRQHAVKGVAEYLQAHGVSSRHSGRLLALYGREAVKILDQDPYRVALDLPGVGFQIADAIAVAKGLERDDPGRVRACLLHTLSARCERGHTHAPQSELIARCSSAFEIAPETLEYHLGALVADDYLVAEAATADTAIYLPALYQAEAQIARRIAAMSTIPAAPSRFRPGGLRETIVSKLALVLSEQQQAALEQLLSQRLAVLTGGPGTGKTTLVRALTVAYETMGYSVTLAAPTGRAAKRLSQVCRRKAATLHRLLRADPHSGYFAKNRDEPLETDVLIVDEMSMVDLLLMHHLLEALHAQTVLIMVGDVFQLPPVGPGNVLADLITAGCVTCIELREIFRQALESPIITNAHRIRNGQLPLLPGPETVDANCEFVFIEQAAIKSAGQTVVRLCGDEIHERFGFDPIDEIQVITPTHKGEAGTLNINRVLQDALNGPDRGRVAQLGAFRRGDKVMHLKNNYHKEVYNGDIGIVRDLDFRMNRLEVDFDGHRVAYEGAELEELSLAYAITVHKSQGSEYPAVVLLLFSQHYMLLQRNLLYTAITRGRQLVVIVGHGRALRRALANDQPQRRSSRLVHRLRQLL